MGCPLSRKKRRNFEFYREQNHYCRPGDGGCIFGKFICAVQTERETRDTCIYHVQRTTKHTPSGGRLVCDRVADFVRASGAYYRLLRKRVWIRLLFLVAECTLRPFANVACAGTLELPGPWIFGTSTRYERGRPSDMFSIFNRCAFSRPFAWSNTIRTRTDSKFGSYECSCVSLLRLIS